MIKLDIKSELPTAVKWTNSHSKQLPFSIAEALNSTVGGSKFIPGSQKSSIASAMEKTSQRTFNQPTAYTTKAWRLGKRATTRKLEAELVPKDSQATGDREPHLRHSIISGQRGVKPFEAKFRTHQLSRLPAGSRLVPATVKLNARGNVSQKTLTDIYGMIGTKVFVGTPKGGGRPPGVYSRDQHLMKRTHTTLDPVLRPLFIAVPSANYRPILRVEQTAQQTAQKVFGNNLRFALTKNVRNEIKRGTADLRTW
tara:strand:- start:331 stop:1092 length:762 start_codon:yes stop_codon:yes gene_type:complete